MSETTAKKVRCLGCGQLVEVPPEAVDNPFPCPHCKKTLRVRRTVSSRVITDPKAPKARAGASIGSRGLIMAIVVTSLVGVGLAWLTYKIYDTFSSKQPMLEEGIPITAQELEKCREPVCPMCMRRFPLPIHFMNHMHEKHPETTDSPAPPRIPIPPE